MKLALTQKAIADAKPGDTLRDTEVPGLQLRAFGNRKDFYFYYRTRLGEQRRPKIGTFGVLTLNEARRIARKLYVDVAAGKDPIGKRQADRRAMTVDELIEVYRERVLPKRKSRYSIARALAQVSASFGKVRVAAAGLADVQKLHDKLTAEGAPIQANRTLATCSALFTFAEKLQQRPPRSNPCYLVDRNPENKRTRYLTPGAEAQAVGAELRKRLYGPYHDSVIFILLLLLTGARRGEIGAARADDLQGNVLLVGDHKTADRIGAKVIHVPQVALDLLNDPKRPPHARDGYLLGTSNPSKMWTVVRRDAGCPDLRLHDLRHSFASIGIGAAVPLDMIGQLLAHTSRQTTMRYSHLIHAPGQEAVNRIAGAVTEALAPPKETA